MHSTSRKEADVKLFDAAQLVPPELLAGFPARPLQSQIIGAVRFGDAVQYCSKPDFDADVQPHFVPASHAAAWGEETSLRVGWRIAAVRRLVKPRPVSGSLTGGFLKWKFVEVEFAAVVDRHTEPDLGAPEVAQRVAAHSDHSNSSERLTNNRH